MYRPARNDARIDILPRRSPTVVSSFSLRSLVAAHTGTEVVAATLNNAGPRIAASVTRDEPQHKLFIKLVNGTSDTQRFQIALDGAPNVKRPATLVTMSGKSPNATNTLTDPDHIKPSEKTIQIAGPKFEYSFVPYSVNVIEMSY
jgi:alpha-L-arabinofuranosidase